MAKPSFVAAHIRIHTDRGRDFRAVHHDPVWHLPVPAVFVVEPSARVAWAFSDVDPSRWPDPQELLASLEGLRSAHALSIGRHSAFLWRV